MASPMTLVAGDNFACVESVSETISIQFLKDLLVNANVFYDLWLIE